MSKTVSEILNAAADLIEPEGAWTQGCSARTADRRRTTSTEAGAVCWCAQGAIRRVAGWNLQGDRALNQFASFMLSGIGEWNDAPERTQAEVVAKLREAAEKAKEQGL